MKYSFPAIFEQDGEQVAVYFPDEESILTCGDNLEHAIFMATDALNFTLLDMEENGEKIPTPTDISDIILKKNQTARMIHADTEAYARELGAQLLSESKINSVRTAAGMTIKKIAEILGAPYATIQKWDSGKVKPSPWVERLAIQEIERYIAANQ